MKRLVKFKLSGDEFVWVEVDEPDRGGAGLVSNAIDKATDKATESFDAAVSKVKPIAETILEKLRGLSELPDEIEVEFGLKLSAEAGAIIASSALEANYTVKLKWVREKSKNKD